MKTLILTLLLFTTPASAWTICWTDEPDNCSSEAEYFAEDLPEGTQEALDDIISIFSEQVWAEGYPIQLGD